MFNFYVHAGDTVMASRSIQYLQHSFNDLIQWAEENNLQMNIEKTEMFLGKAEKWSLETEATTAKNVGEVLQISGHLP